MIMQTHRRVAAPQDPSQTRASTQRADERIQRRTEASIAFYTQNPEQIPQRLAELDEEWDLERAMATGASGLTLASLVFSVLRGGKWLLLGLGVQGLVMQHALGRRSAPIELLRNVGLRTRQEIENERLELESLLDDAGGPDEDTGGTEQGSESGDEGRQRETSGSERSGSNG
jgi:hypothetical protein